MAHPETPTPAANRPARSGRLSDTDGQAAGSATVRAPRERARLSEDRRVATPQAGPVGAPCGATGRRSHASACDHRRIVWPPCTFLVFRVMVYSPGTGGSTRVVLHADLGGGVTQRYAARGVARRARLLALDSWSASADQRRVGRSACAMSPVRSAPSRSATQDRRAGLPVRSGAPRPTLT